MQLSQLLELPQIHDIITTQHTIFLITNGEETPAIYTEKEVVRVRSDELLRHPRIHEILAGTSLRNPDTGHQLTPVRLYEYALKGLTTAQKQQFSHKLYGTGGRSSQLKKMHGSRVGRAAFWVPHEHTKQAEGFLKEHGVQYKTTRLLVQEAKP